MGMRALYGKSAGHTPSLAGYWPPVALTAESSYGKRPRQMCGLRQVLILCFRIIGYYQLQKQQRDTDEQLLPASMMPDKPTSCWLTLPFISPDSC